MRIWDIAPVRNSTYALLVLALLSCRAREEAPPATTTTAMPSAAEQLQKAVEDWFDEDLRQNPFRATYIGDHRFDDRFGNPASPEYLEQMRANWTKALTAVRVIDPAQLSPAQRLTREIFIYNAEDALEGLKFPGRLLPMNQLDNLVLDFAKFGSGEGPQPFETEKDHERWLSRAAELPAWVDAAIAAMTEGAGHQVTLPKVAMSNVVEQMADLAKEPFAKSLFAAPLKKLDDATRARLEPRYVETFDGKVLPALKKLAAYLRDGHLGQCRTTDGWSALPGGKDWYAWQVRHFTTTTMTPEEIHALGKAEVARIVAEMDGVRQKLGFKQPMPKFFAWARESPEHFFKKPDELLEGYRRLKTTIDAGLPALFSVFPKAAYEVRAVEAFRAESAPGAEYQQPSADGTRPGIFYVNTFNLKAQPKYGMETLSLHEAAPGHHFQVALQQELDLPRFRRFGGYTAYEEGWALYAETLGHDLGLFKTPMDYYGHLNDAQLRAMRLVVDTGLHSQGWSRQQAIDFMLANSSLAESDVTAEVERYMVWPGQALGYKVGQLRILAMKKRAEEAMGKAFDVKAFHKAVLEDGALPLTLLERKIDSLVAGKLAGK